MLSAGVDVLRADRRTAVIAAFTADASERRAEAARLTLEADGRELVTRDLVEQLERLEGCKYVPFYLSPGSYSDTPVRTPLSVQQRQFASELVREAVRLENHERVRDAGVAEAAGVDELVKEATASPFMIAPREDHMRTWAATAATEAAPRQQSGAQTHFKYSLHWRGGEILSGSSRATVTYP